MEEILITVIDELFNYICGYDYPYIDISTDEPLKIAKRVAKRFNIELSAQAIKHITELQEKNKSTK